MFMAPSIGRTGNLIVFVIISGVFCVTASAQQGRNPQTPARPAATSAPAPAASETLPLRRVVLYKSGVGYFEHGGVVRGNQDVKIDLTSSQLDDVLKSLTALDLNGGRIVGASYGSQEPAGHQLESLPVPVAGNQTLASLLEGLRGIRLEVSTSTGAFNGRLLSAEDMRAEQVANRLQHQLLGQAIGEGIAYGLEVARPSPPTAQPILRVEPGLAISRAGEALRLTKAIDVSLVRPQDGSTPTPADSIFSACQPPQSSVYVTGSGVYLLTIGPAKATTSSWVGCSGMRWSRATPPIGRSVMSAVGTP